MRKRNYWSGVADREALSEPLVIKRNSGIWNTDLFPETAIPIDALGDAQDIYPGTFKRMDNVLRVGKTASGTSPITGVHLYAQADGDKLLIYSKVGVVYAGDMSGSTDTALESSLTANNFEFVTYQQDNSCYFVNGDNGLMMTDGTSANTSAVTAYSPSGAEPANYLADSSNAIHDSKYIEIHDNVMHLAGPATQPSRVYRCDEVRGPTYWHHHVDFTSPMGGGVRGIRSFNGVLIVLKSDSIHASDGYIGDSSFNKRVLHARVGCISGRTAVEVPGMGLVFMGHDRHFYLLKPEYVRGENIPLIRLSAHISNLIKQIPQASAVNACAGVKGNRYYCSAYSSATATYNDFGLVFDYTDVRQSETDPTAWTVPWTTFSKLKANCFTNDADTLYFGESTPVSTSLTNVNAVDGGSPALTSHFFIMRNHAFGFPDRDKYLSNIYFTGQQVSAETVTPTISIDNGTFASLDTVSMTPTAAATTSRYTQSFSGLAAPKYGAYTMPVNQLGQGFQLKMAGATEITELRYEYTVEEIRPK